MNVDTRGGNHTPLFTLSMLTAALLAATFPIHAQNTKQAGNKTSSVTGSVPLLNSLRIQGQLEEELQHTPGAVQIIGQDELENSDNMAEVMRYQPLITAPGTASGGTRNQSRYDRAGTTGYNIRGIEGNRIGLDVDGVEMPDAVDRANTSGQGRAAVGTFGMGRDFIDPDTYSSVEIQSGTTNSRRSSGGIGGAVSFRTKSPEDFVSSDKPMYFGARLRYDNTDRSWLKGITAAATNGNGLSGLINYTRRDGKQTRNNSDEFKSYPAKWHTDALLLKGGLQVNADHKLILTADLYRRKNESTFDNWNTAVTAIASRSDQDSKTERNTLSLTHEWTPESNIVDAVDTRLYYQNTNMDDYTYTTPIAAGPLQTDRSRNKTHTWGLSVTGAKEISNHHLQFGINASQSEVSHPLQVATGGAQQPYPDTRSRRFGGFIEDEIVFDAGGHRLALIPGLRVDRIQEKMIHSEDFDNDRMPQETLNKRYASVPSTTITSPSFSVVYDILPRLSAYAQWKSSGRAPNNNEIFGYWNGGGGSYAVIGNPNLKKESSHAFDIGLKGSPTSGVTLTSSLFYTHYRDFIAYTRYTRANNPEMFTNIHPSLSTLYQADNRDNAKIKGFELTARFDHGQWSPSLQGFHSIWAVGYSKGQAKSYYLDDGYVDMESVPPAKAVVGLGYDAPEKRWGLNITGTFVRGKQATSTTRNTYSNNPGTPIAASTVENQRVPGYAKFDLSSYWQINKNVRLDAGVYNLTDKQYWDYSSARSLQVGNAADVRNRQLLTNPGRTFSLGVAVQF